MKIYSILTFQYQGLNKKLPQLLAVRYIENVPQPKNPALDERKRNKSYN